MKKALVLAGFVCSFVFNLQATVSVTGGTGGTGISADKSANATTPGWTSLSAIVVAEQNGAGGRADFGGGTIILKAPTGFEFNTNQRPSVVPTITTDLTGASFVSMDSTTLTLSITVAASTKNDTFSIGSTTNLQVRPTSGFVLTNGIVYRLNGASGGTATLNGLNTSTNGNGSGATPFASLSVVAGNAKKLAFIQSPASANVGAVFGTQPIIRTQDQFNNTTSAALGVTESVTIALNTGTGPLLGTTTTNIGTGGGNGVINSADLRIDSVGADKQLSASSANFTTALSSVFTVAQGSQVISFPAIPDRVYGDGPFTLAATASSGLQVSYAVISGAAVVTNDVVTIIGAGPVSVEASQGGDANWNAAAKVTNSFTVAKASPAITWNNPGDITYGTPLDLTNHLNATTTISGSFLYSPVPGTILNAGSNQLLSVTFTPTDSANYSNATATVLINVAKANQTITFGPLPDKLTTDAAFPLTATASSGLDVSYTVVTGPAVITNNVVSLTGATGLVTVQASQAGDGNYNAATNVEQSFNVNNGTPTITWNTPADLPYGTPLSTNQLSATANVAGTFAYTPDFGTLLPLGTNQVLSVTFTPTDTNSYSIVSTNVLINVIKGTPVITWGNPAAITYGAVLSTNELNASADVSGTFTYTPDVGTVLNAGTNQLLTVGFVPDDTANYNNANASAHIDVLQVTPVIIWASPGDIVYGAPLTTNQLNATANVSGTFVYTPDAGFVLNAGSNQTLSLTFTPADSTNYATVSTNVEINVLKATPSLTWNTPAGIVYGTALDTNQLNATSSVSGSFAYTPNVGTILNAGNGQQLTVVFTPTDAANYNSTNASIFIDVAQATPSLSWTNPADIFYGTALSSNELNATASIAGTFAYTPDFGAVLQAGLAQTLQVVFTPADSTNYTSASTNVSLNVLKATPAISWPTPADLIYGAALSATELNATSLVAGTFIYSPTNGTVLNAGSNQVLSVSFVPEDNTNYNNANTNVLITVLRATPVVSWSNPTSIVYGTALGSTQLNASVNVPGTLTYNPTNGTVLNAGTRTLSVSFVPDDTTNYAAISTNVSIIVLKAPTTITWNAPADITYGTLLSTNELNATTSVPGNLSYSPAAGALLNAGTQTLSVIFTPTDSVNYEATNAAVSITVNKATPVIAWNTPLDISYGTALSGTQLNATANTAGAFTYNPTNGTILNVGSNQMLSVSFIPTDSTNYNNASTNVVINVLKATPTISWSNPANIVYGTLLGTNELNATANTSGNFVYTPDFGTQLNAGAGQTLSVVFTPEDTTNYDSIGTNVSITVLKATPTISWSNPTDIVYGTLLSAAQLNAIPSVPGTVSYSPTNGALLNAGINQTLSASFVPTDTTNYNNANTNVAINVLKAAVTLTWNNPADINYGTALSASQLNATSSVPGNFVYSPASGTVLAAGINQTLSVNFTPTSANYSNASAAVSLNVQKVPLLIKANDATRLVGQVNPTFAATYTGFVNGDTSNSLTAPVVFSTLADTNSAAGFYDIVPGGAASGNYNISFANGTLTVSPSSTIVSTGVGGNWSATGTWVGGVVPGAGDNVVIVAGSTVTVDVAANAFSITLSNSATTAATLNVSASRSLTVGGGSGLITVGQNQPSVTTGSTCLLNVAGTLQCGNINLVARRPVNRNADAVLRISNASAVVTVTNNISQDRNTAAGSLLSQVEFTAAGLLKIGGGFVSLASGGTLVPGTGTVEYYATGDQTIGGLTYNNLTLSGSGNKTGSAAVTIGATGTLLLKDTAVYAGPTPTYTAGSTLFYARTGAQVTGSALPALSPANWNLSVSNASGITLRQSATVTGTLRLFAGTITTTPTNSLTVDGPVIRSAGYVVGNLRKNFAIGSNVERTFEVGVTSSYAPVSITFSNVSTAGYVTVSANPGKHVAIGSSILDASKGVNLNWSASNDLSLVADAYNAVFNYTPADLDGSASSSLLIVGDYTSGAWTYPVVAARTGTSLQVNGLTSFSDFQLAESGSRIDPVITWSNPSDIIYGAALTTNELSATANTAGTFLYTPSTGTVLSAGNGQTLTVVFTPNDLATYNVVTNNVSINVLKATPTITWNTPANLVYGALLTTNELNASANAGGNFVYLPPVGTQLNAGTNILSATFTPTDSANYSNATATVSIVVLKATPILSWSGPASITYGTLLGTNELNATASVDGTFVYTPAAGTQLNVGTNLLAVSFLPTDSANYSEASNSVSIVVTKAVPSVSWNAPSDITYNTALSTNQLNASSAVPGTFVYAPDLGAILDVGTNQTLSVTFTPTDTNSYEVIVTNVVINVLKATPNLSWSSPSSMVYGTALSTNELNATAEIAGSFNYTPDVGAILNAGTNTLSVTFIPADTTNYNNVSTNVTLVVTKADPSITWTNPASIVFGTGLTTNELNATADVAGTFNYSPAVGAVLNAGTNNLSVSFVPSDSTNYNNASASVELVVTPVISLLSWSTPADIVYGTALSSLQLNATSAVSGSFTYSPTNGTVLDAGTNIVLSVTFVPNDTTNYTGAATNVFINVLKAPTSITWSNPGAITYGTTLSSAQLNAVASVPGSLNYTPTLGAVLNAGTNVLSVTFTPADSTNYLGTNATVSIVVSKAPSGLAWVSPGNIVYGAALTTNELNATANVAGTFTYTPDVGAILNCGTNVLGVSFVPNDITNYLGASTTTTLVITPASLSVTANNSSREYGLTNPLFSGVLSGVQNGDNISATYSSVAAVSSNIGDYPIVPTLVDPDNKLTNYVTAITNGTLTLTAAPLTAVADDKTKVYGSANPAFTGIVTGVRNSDDITAVFSCSATTSSGAGDYPITITLLDPNSRGTNYFISTTNGTLSIVKDTPTVSLVSSLNPAPVGGAVILTATISSTNVAVTNGFVDFTIDVTNTLSALVSTNSEAYVVFHFATLGAHSVTATFVGDANRNSAGSSPFIQSVVALPQDVLAVIHQPNGSAIIRFAGDGVSTYTVQKSSNLINWSNLGTTTTGGDGLQEILDSGAASQSSQFYRAVKN